MKLVRSLVAGTWKNAPFNPARDYEKILVMSLEYGRWSVNRTPVDVIPGCIVAFHEEYEARFFLENNRGVIPTIDVGHPVAFADAEDAAYFLRQGLAGPLTQGEVDEIMRQVRGESDNEAEGDDEMMKSKGIENKGITKPAETKDEKPAKSGKPAKGKK